VTLFDIVSLDTPYEAGVGNILLDVSDLVATDSDDPRYNPLALLAMEFSAQYLLS
jgi:hypothetical protein